MVFIDWFWPGYLAGGPVQSLVSLVGYLGEDFCFKIVTGDRDLNSSKPYAGIQPDTWIKSELGCEVYYASNINTELLTTLIKKTSFDLVYINSFFSRYFSIIPLQILTRERITKPVVLAPRGMLGEGALALKKWKKKAFIIYSKLTGLHNKVIWHATSEQEKQEIRSLYDSNSITIISNLPKKLTPVLDKHKEKGELNLCFVSRVSEKKNLLYALRVLKGIENGTIHYSIFGPLEDETYWRSCEEEIKALPGNIRCEYKGSIGPAEIEKTLAGQHFMFLPTMNENFGHSIVESLMCGCPVIISDQTPWKDLEENKAGYAIDLGNRAAFTKAINSALQMDQAEFSHWSSSANKYISRRINLKKITDEYKNLFNDPV